MGHRKEKQKEQAGRPRGAPAVHEQDLGPRRPGYYGSGGSYSYGGGFEHPNYPEHETMQERRTRESSTRANAYAGLGPMEPFAAYGGFAEGEDFAQRSRRLPGVARGPYFGRSPKGYTRSDQRIREDICDQLMFGHVDPSEVSVVVSGGEVTLEGRVDNRRAKYLVEEIAASVPGVHDVDNRLRVPRPLQATSGETPAADDEGRSVPREPSDSKPHEHN